MAYRRNITTQATHFAKRFNPCFGYISRDHDNKNQEELIRPKIDDFLTQRRSFGNYVNNSWRSSNLFHQQRSIFPGNGRTGVYFHRYLSTSIGEGSDNVEYISNVAGVISDAPMETIASQAPVVSEVAIAAADSMLPVAALQYLIDGVHSFTGLNWWAAIALTTLLIRGATIPFMINQLKATSKLALMRPRLEEYKAEMEAKGMDPQAVLDGKQKMNALFKEYGVTPFAPLKGILIQGPVFISFFFAITNMAEKMPSFKNGGAFWFTDLTIPDSTYIFPVLTALTFLINVEFNVQEGLEGTPSAGTMKNFSRVLAVLTVPFTMNFPQALFCYWVTSNIFSFGYGSVLKIPSVKKALGIPDLPVEPPTTTKHTKQPGLTLLQQFKQLSAATKRPASTPAASQQPNTTNPKTSSSSSSSSSAVLSQRLRSLERKVKQKKKNKKL